MRTDADLTKAINGLKEFLRWPSVSTDPARKQAVADCGRWLTRHLQSIGLQAKLHPTRGHPVIVARGPHRPGRPTVLIYGHYDVQPPDPVKLWQTPPFEPTVRGGKLYARGAADNKGQVFAHITAVERALQDSKAEIPNIIFLIEGEEEVGSTSLEPFLKAHRHELQPDIVVVSDNAMFAPGLPTITYGLRGLMALELRVYGPARDLHSGVFGGTVANPATVLAQLIASLHDPKTWQVRVPGFYKGVKPLQVWERKQWRALPFSAEQYRRELGVPSLACEAGYTPQECRWGRPTLEVNGIFGGYQGEGSKTVIPAWAGAKLTARLVPGQSPAAVFRSVREHLKRQSPPSVRVEIEAGHSGEAYLAPVRSPYLQAADRALRSAWKRAPVYCREGGSIPILNAFKKILGADSMLIGFCLPDSNMHSPDENLDLEVFAKSIESSGRLLTELASLP